MYLGETKPLNDSTRSTITRGAFLELSNGFTDVYKQLGKLHLPILLLWGRNDHTIPIEQSDQQLKLIQYAEFQFVEDSGNIPHYEGPDFLNLILNQFLTSK